MKKIFIPCNSKNNGNETTITKKNHIKIVLLFLEKHKLGDSSFSATTFFHALDIPHEITD